MPYVSQSALESIAADIRRYGLPELTSRRDMYEASNVALAEYNTFGELLVKVPLHGTEKEMVDSLAVNLLSYIDAATSQKGYQLLVDKTLALRPSTPEDPWNLVLYADEVDPGDPVAPRAHTRKIWSFYFSFLEFGEHVLSKEEAWLTCRIERTIDVPEISAGMLVYITPLTCFCCITSLKVQEHLFIYLPRCKPTYGVSFGASLC